VQQAGQGEVPVHLRDASYRQAKTLGHGVGYEYPHDHPEGWVDQQYRPAQLADAVFYEPSAHGDEAALLEESSSSPARGGSGGDDEP
jgi:putative ATPase